MLLNEQVLQSADFILKTKARSFTFGRRLYQVQTQPLDAEPSLLFWLKTQQRVGVCSKHAILGFQHELGMYALLHSLGAHFLLPFQIVPVKKLKHQLFDACESQGLLLPDASSVFDQIPEELGVAQIKWLLLQIVEMFDELTRLGWLHADIKKEHFVVYEGRVRLIDFEQALALNTSSLTTMNATPRYMAPELFQGQAKSIQSDIYAFGIVLLEWLTGQRLQAQSYEDWAYLHCQRLNIDLPQHFLCFKPLLQMLLAKQKSQRVDSFDPIKTCLITEIV